jgi:hypothetical protein
VDQPTDAPPVLPTLQALALPAELPACERTVGLMLPPKPRTVAPPKPVAAAGVALVPRPTLSKVQAVRVVAADALDNAAARTVAIQARLFIFI